MLKLLNKNLFLLLIYFIVSLAGYIIIALTNHLFYNRLFGNTNFKYLESPLTILIYFFLIVSFLLIIFKLPEKDFKQYFKLIIICSLLIAVVLLFLPPITSSDAWQYIMQAKIYNFYHANPYVTAPAQFPNDILTANISDPLMTVVYGPLFTGLTILLNLLSQSNIYLNIFFLKLVNLLLIIATAYIIFKLLKQYNKEKLYSGLFFFITNPLIFYETLLNGHNDIIMIFPLVLAIYFLFKNKLFWVLPLIFISALIKPLSLILLPIFFIYLLLKKYSLLKFLGSLIVSSLIFILSWLPFYQGPQTWSGWQKLGSQTNHWLLLAAARLNFNLVASRTILLTFFLLCLFFILSLIYKNRNYYLSGYNFFKPLIMITIIYFLLASFWLHAWYLLILLPFLTFYLSKRRLLIFYFAFYCFVLTYGFLLDNLLL